MPTGKISTASVQRILGGGAAVCRSAGIPIAGGHSIDSPEPIYGLVALGTVHPDRVLRNSGARDGDALVLAKGLGIGVFSAALKQERLSPRGYEVMLGSMTQLNAVGREVAAMDGVHAMTDVTGFGLLGHGLEMCRGAGLGASISWAQVPILEGAAELAQAGVGTGAARRNWHSFGADVRLPSSLPEWQRGLLCDPQTSGGLLIAASPDIVGTLLDHLRAAGFAQAAAVGTMRAGAAGIEVI
jgi:selenide,water dikinase